MALVIPLWGRQRKEPGGFRALPVVVRSLWREFRSPGEGGAEGTGEEGQAFRFILRPAVQSAGMVKNAVACPGVFVSVQAGSIAIVYCMRAVTSGLIVVRKNI